MKIQELSLSAVRALLRRSTADVRLLAIDVGSSNCGLAISGPGNTIAFPLHVYKRSSLAKDVAQIKALLGAHCPPSQTAIGALVVGLPLTLDAAEDKNTRAVRQYAHKLAIRLFAPQPPPAGSKNDPIFQPRQVGTCGPSPGVLYWDERFSTQLVLKEMRQGGLSIANQKAKRDTHAAALLLQEVLDVLHARRAEPES